MFRASLLKTTLFRRNDRGADAAQNCIRPRSTGSILLSPIDQNSVALYDSFCSLCFCPLIYSGFVTVRVAALEVTEPSSLVTTQRYWLPLLASTALKRMDAVVLPDQSDQVLSFAFLYCH